MSILQRILSFWISILYLIQSQDCQNSIPGTLCLIKCDLVDECKDSTINCRANDPCEIQCTAKASCENSDIRDQGATDVSIICDAENACGNNGKFDCGLGECIIICSNQQDACKDIDLTIGSAISFECNPPTSGYSKNLCSSLPNPTHIPTVSPTPFTLNPTTPPTNRPSNFPSINPSVFPSQTPSKFPSHTPSFNPSQVPSSNPSMFPSKTPSNNPSQFPSKAPTLPTVATTMNPTRYPTKQPTQSPVSNVPTLSPVSTEDEAGEIVSTLFGSAGEIKAGDTPQANTNITTLIVVIVVGICYGMIVFFVIFIWIRKNRQNKNVITSKMKIEGEKQETNQTDISMEKVQDKLIVDGNQQMDDTEDMYTVHTTKGQNNVTQKNIVKEGMSGDEENENSHSDTDSLFDQQHKNVTAKGLEMMDGNNGTTKGENIESSRSDEDSIPMGLTNVGDLVVGINEYT